MGKQALKSTDAIEKLLGEKQEVEGWLERLNSAGNKTPAQVRKRVGSDYEKRLKKVLKQLEGYREDLTTALTAQQEESEKLTAAEEAVAERLAEAELRHSVGEYNEKAWAKLSGEINDELSKAQDDLGQVESEISRLEEILELIENGPAAAQEEPAPEEADELDEGDGDEDSERESGQTDAFDELAFIKSVTDDEGSGPSAARASGTHSAVDEVPPLEESGASIGAKGVEALPERGQTPKKGKVKKSLKCGECGAQNLPTEWYCERCGAELAAL